MKFEPNTFVCRLCEGKESRPFLQTFDRYDSSSRYQLFQCRKCGLVTLHPIPDSFMIESTYPKRNSNPFLYFQNQDVGFLQKLYTFFHPYSIKWRIKQIEKAAGAGRLLDMNCGNGDLLYELRQRLWDVIGVEPRKSQADFARNTLALKIYASLDDLPPTCQGYFDIITFWHNFGDFADFNQILAKAGKLLQPDGVILLALPNWVSLDFWFYRHFWSALDSPRRIIHFGPRQVRSLLKHHSLQLKYTRVIPFDIYYNCLLSERIMLENRRLKRKFKLLRYSRSLIIAMVAHILSISGSGSGMLYLIRKRGHGAQ